MIKRRIKKSEINKGIRLCGNKAQFAHSLGIDRRYLHMIIVGKRPFPKRRFERLDLILQGIEP